MSREFLDDLRVRIQNEFADNSTGLITPAIMRNMLEDIIDSTVNDEANIFRALATPAIFAATATMANLVGVCDTADVSSNMDGATANANAGTVTTGTVAGRSYNALIGATIEAANGVEVQIAFGVSGAATAFGQEVTGRGAGSPVNITIPAFADSLGANVVTSIMVATPGGPANVTFTEVYYSLVILPTNNP